MVSGSSRRAEPTVIHVDGEALARNRIQFASSTDAKVRSFVGCGRCLSGQRVVIVDPESRLPCPEECVGEIWIQGPSVAAGYYERAAATAARLSAPPGRQRRGPVPPQRGSGLCPQPRVVRNRPGERPDHRPRPEFLSGRHRTHGRSRLRRVARRLRRRFFRRPGRSRPAGDRSGGRTSPARSGYRRGAAGDSPGRGRAARVGGSRHRAGQGRGRSQDIQRKDAAFRLPRTVPRAGNWKFSRRGSWIVAVPRRSIFRKTTARSFPPGLPRGPRPRPKSRPGWFGRSRRGCALPEVQIRVTTPFLEFGMGSLDAVEIAAGLERWLRGDCRLPRSIIIPTSPRWRIGWPIRH